MGYSSRACLLIKANTPSLNREGFPSDDLGQSQPHFGQVCGTSPMIDTLERFNFAFLRTIDP